MVAEGKRGGGCPGVGGGIDLHFQKVARGSPAFRFPGTTLKDGVLAVAQSLHQRLIWIAAATNR